MSEASLVTAVPHGRALPNRLLEFVRHRRVVTLLAVALISLGTIAGIWMSWSSWQSNEVVIEIGAPLVYRPMPEFLADLNPTGGRVHHIRLKIVAQVPETAVHAIDQKEPEIIALIQAHLRQLQRPDLIGEAGADRLRHNILAMVNAAIAPEHAHNLLFTQFLLD